MGQTASGRWLITFAFVCRVGSQRISEEAIFAAVAVEAGRVVDALQAFSRQAVAISDRVGIDVGVALAQPAKPHRAVRPLRVSKVAIIAELTSLTCARHNRMLGKKGLRGFRCYWLRRVCLQISLVTNSLM